MPVRLPTPSNSYEASLNQELTKYFREIEQKLAKIQGYKWNDNHPIMGQYHIWIDSSGRLRIKSSQPTSDTDGTIVGLQS